MKVYTPIELLAEKIAREIFNRKILDKEDIKRIVEKHLRDEKNNH